MSVAKILDHLEGDAERIKKHVAIIRNGLSMVNPNKDVRMEIDNSLWELFRVTHSLMTCAYRCLRKHVEFWVMTALMKMMTMSSTF